jgi:hypothetical protein
MDKMPLSLQQQRAFEFIRSEINRWEDYHTHKEQMAWVATGLILSGATGLFLVQLPENIVCFPPTWLMLLAGVGITAASGVAFVTWQLGMREGAADRQLACGILAKRWITKPPEEAELGIPDHPTTEADADLRALSTALATLPHRPWQKDPVVARCLTLIPIFVWTFAALARILFAPLASACFRNHG